MTNSRKFWDLEVDGIDVVELLGGDRSLATEEFANLVNKLGTVGDELHADLLQLLSYRRFDNDEARRIWQGILKHKRKMTAKLGRDPGVRVSALDYLTNIRHLLDSPRIVDRGDFGELVSHVHIDELTGMFNRRHVRTMFQHEIRRARRYSKTLSLMLIDIDNFKTINDSFGHIAGDRVLVALADLLREVCRETDTIGRFGGDEIVVIAPEAKKSDAFALAERIRRAARERRLFLDEEKREQEIRFSISVGIATYPDDSQESAELLHLADEALYASKKRGRDVVSIYDRDAGRAAEGDIREAGA